ncbi:MAG: SURF1 family protein [Acidimicrobiia bacterium]|nr:MAG: SURF1 family protein [Acidimicrobiia bacterium]
MSSPLLRPRWLVGHVLVTGLTVVFVFLGFWQLDRHFDQQEDNASLEERLTGAPVELGAWGGSVEELEFRQVQVSGRYDYDDQLELRPRARNGQVGYQQVVPLDTNLGIVLVNRGFIADATGSARQTPQASGPIEVVGTVRLSQGRSSLGPQNPEEGELEVIARLDLDRLNPQFGNALFPAYLELIAERPDPGGLPTVLLPEPSPTSRPHILYAIQWWAFAAVSTVGWLLYLRKQFFTP